MILTTTHNIEGFKIVDYLGIVTGSAYDSSYTSNGTKMSFKDLGIMSIMAPKGLVPAILASIPIQYGLAGGESIQMLSFAVVLLSIIICSILVIILSQNPFKIGYLKTVLGTEGIEEEATETAAEEIPEQDQKAINIINPNNPPKE